VQSRIVVTSGAIFDVAGILMLGMLAIIAIAAGIVAYKTASTEPMLIPAAMASPLVIGAAFAFNPGTLGIQVSDRATMGEDSVALLGVPNRVMMASASIVSGFMMLVGGISAVLGAACVVKPELPYSTWLLGRLPPLEFTWGAIGYVALGGFWPLAAFLYFTGQHLLLGTLEAIHAVGRQARNAEQMTKPKGLTDEGD
jgi:hypothetical protein